MHRDLWLNAERGAHAAGARRRRTTLLCLSHLRWEFVYQRPQHLLSRAAKTFDVYFFEEPIFEATGSPRVVVTRHPSNVTVVVPVLPAGCTPREWTNAQRRLLDDLLAATRPERLLAWYYTPLALTFSRHIAPDLCVYDNMDELAAFRGAPPELAALERELFLRADIVFTGGQSLHEAKCRQHRNIHLFASSIDASHFAQARLSMIEPPDQSALARPRLGFFGVIDERMDLDLVATLADLRPEWQLVMIGPVVKIDPATLPRRPNLHWMGPKAYHELPAYLAGWDIGIMPFALNEATRFISPTKTPEFLAAGVPVISTPIKDVVRSYGEQGLVEIAGDAPSIVAKVMTLMRRPKDCWLARVDAHLATTSWDKTWAGMSELLRASFRPGQARPAMGATTGEHMGV
ncbi:MAG TPA: glycosyltransferase family 1 protein [Aestuariivirgaceae bacterium]|nr:glycosyltransferase family 1 protein [Aestuariivirgaceae bacterium]